MTLALPVTNASGLPAIRSLQNLDTWWIHVQSIHTQQC